MNYFTCLEQDKERLQNEVQSLNGVINILRTKINELEPLKEEINRLKLENYHLNRRIEEFNNVSSLKAEINFLKAENYDLNLKLNSINNKKNVTINEHNQNVNIIEPKQNVTINEPKQNVDEDPQNETLFNQKIPISEELCTFFGLKKGSLISRSEASKRLCSYAKENKLMKNQHISTNDAILKLFRLSNLDSISITNLQQYLKIHYK